MPITCTSSDRNLTAALYGDVDHHGAKQIMKELNRQIDRVLPNRLILDCSGITFMDSSGIAILLRARMRMQELGGSVVAAAVPVQAAKVLQAAGLSSLVQLV